MGKIALSKNKHIDLLLISVDSPVLLGIYGDKRLVRDFCKAGKFSDVLPELFGEILPQVLSLILNSIVVKLQAERDAGGSIIAHWKISEIENVLIPLFDFKLQEQIALKIQKSFTLRTKSKDLLQNAKIKLENAIEKGTK